MLEPVFLVFVIADAKLETVPGVSFVKLQSQDRLNSLGKVLTVVRPHGQRICITIGTLNNC